MSHFDPMPPLRSTFARFFTVGFALAIFVLALVFYFAYQKIQSTSEAANQVIHSQVVRLELSQINLRIQEATAMHRRFLTSQDSGFLKSLVTREAKIFSSLDVLDSLVRDNPVQQSNMDSLRYLVYSDLVLMKKVTWPDIQNRTATWTNNREMMDSINARVGVMDQFEAEILTRQKITRDESLHLAPFFALLLLLVALAILVFSYLRIKNDLKRSRRQLEINLENTKKIVQLNETLQHAERISQTGNWQMDLKTGERHFSDNLYRLFGFGPGAFAPELDNWLPLVHADDRHLVLDFVETAGKKIDPPSITFRLARPDGQLRYLYASGKIVVDAQGEQVLIGTAQDVTEAHRLRQELEERTRFLELLVESSMDMITAYDKDLRYTVWNQRCVELLHFTKEQVLGRSILELFPQMQGNELLEIFKQPLTGQPAYISPRASLISERFYESFLQPLRDETGEVSGVLSVIHDVTESYRLRRELEERSRFAEMIIDSSVDMIITYDTGLLITAWNKKSEEVFGLTKEEVLGRHVREIFPDLVDDQRLADLGAVLQGQIRRYEPQELIPFGIYANLYLLPLKDHSGQVTGVLSISHDVTDVVRAAAELEEKNRQLANTNAELASFSYVASHDLQEPLRKIQAFGSRILSTENDRLSDTGKDAFRRMQSAADRMQQLIEDLLTYSRTNTDPGEFAVVDLNKVLHEAEQDVSEVVKEKKAVIEADELPPARVMAFQFRQLLTNLLSNALKYQRPGVEPRIRITCVPVAAQEVPFNASHAERYFHIAVQDNGIGFEQQYAERIFELFQRLHGRSEYQGTGIGLAICRKIMQNHHGFLSAEGRPGEGATFHIYLPA